MDYEKKYKQALGWMQSLYNGLHGKTKEEAEHFFPELKESEGERIRKALISFLKSPFVNENITDEKVIPWIAWLEKQGQRKTIDEQSENCDTCTNDKGCVACENGELYEQKPTDYTKSNRKKCEEISELDWSGEAPEDRTYLAAYIMAEWKDAQHEEERKELRGLVNMLPIDDRNQTIIEDLKGLLS